MIFLWPDCLAKRGRLLQAHGPEVGDPWCSRYHFTRQHAMLLTACQQLAWRTVIHFRSDQWRNAKTKTFRDLKKMACGPYKTDHVRATVVKKRWKMSLQYHKLLHKVKMLLTVHPEKCIFQLIKWRTTSDFTIYVKRNIKACSHTLEMTAWLKNDTRRFWRYAIRHGSVKKNKTLYPVMWS